MAFQIHKGIDEQMEFKGLRAPFLYYMLAAMGGAILLYLILQGVGVPGLLALGLALVALLWCGSKLYRLNRELGRDGMMKKSAHPKIPLVIRCRKRSPILDLRNSKIGRLE